MRLAGFLALLGGVAWADVAVSPPDPAAALVDQWQAAQNQGDFGAYRGLYAARFSGVRRSGPRTVTLDRAGWLRDRARMFRNPMRVEVTGLERTRLPTGWRVTFTQTFQSGEWRDRGEKRMTLVEERGRLHIASEQMVDSQPLPTDAATAAALLGPFADKKLPEGCFGWSPREHDAFCLRGAMITMGGDGPSVSAGFTADDGIALPACRDDGAYAEGIICDLGKATARALYRQWREAGTVPLTDMEDIDTGSEVPVGRGARLRFSHRLTGEATFDDRLELRCKGRANVLLENHQSGNRGGSAAWKLLEGHWLVVQYDVHIAAEGEYGSIWDATVIDVADACR